MLNLDTHILLFAMSGGLHPAERRLLARHSWGISSIVYWELSKLVQKGRVRLDLDDGDVVRFLSHLEVWPIDLAVSVTSTRLDFVSDPADEIIAATSVVHAVPLVTRDRTIRRSRVVPLA